MQSSDIVWIKKTNEELTTRNTKLAEMLKSSRDKLKVLYQQLEELAAPPSTYGTFLEYSPEGTTAEVFTANRKMRLPISPLINPEDLVGRKPLLRERKMGVRGGITFAEMLNGMGFIARER